MESVMDAVILPVLKDSSVHGMKYLAQPNRPLWERIIWLVILLASTGGASYFIYLIFRKYTENPVIVSFQPSDTTIQDIPFPAVTVCSNNRFKKSVYERELQIMKTGNDEEKNISTRVLRGLDHICSLRKAFHKKFNYSANETTVNLCGRTGIGCDNDFSEDRLHAGMQEFDTSMFRTMEAFPTCEEMIPLCIWEGEGLDCSDLFHFTITDMGMCCTFNMMPRDKLFNMARRSPFDRDLNETETAFWTNYGEKFDQLLQAEPGSESEILKEHQKYLKFQSKAGQVSGLSLLLNVDPEEYFCSNYDSHGFRILTHAVIEPPSIGAYGKHIPPNAESFMSVLADVTRTEENVKALDNKIRGCLFSDEHPLESFSVYTSANCVHQCVAEEVALVCNCTRLDMPLKFAKKELREIGYCEGEGHRCAAKQGVNMTVIGIQKVCKHWNCKPSCNKIVYTPQTSFLPLRRDFSVDPRVKNLYKNRELRIGTNVSIVHIFFGSDNVYSRVRKQLYGVNDFIAQIGGILGLFLGLSVLSLTEASNYIFKAVMRQNGKKNNAKPKSIQDKPHVADWTKAWELERQEERRIATLGKAQCHNRSLPRAVPGYN